MNGDTLCQRAAPPSASSPDESSSENYEDVGENEPSSTSATWRQRLESSMLQQQISIQRVTHLLEGLRQEVATLQAAHATHNRLKPKLVRQHVAYYLFTQFPKVAVIKVCIHMNCTASHCVSNSRKLLWYGRKRPRWASDIKSRGT